MVWEFPAAISLVWGTYLLCCFLGRIRSDRSGWPRANTSAATMAAAHVLLLPLVATSTASATDHDLCPEPGTTAGPPVVQYLRSYRAELNGPVRLALDRQDRLYIADPASGRVVIRDTDGRLLEDRGGLGYPVAVAVDDHAGDRSRIYVADGRRGAVTAYRKDWTPVLQLGLGEGEFVQPADLAVDPDTGRVYVADIGTHSIRVYDTEGALISTFGSKGVEPGQFQNPVGLFLNSTAGEILVADQLNFRLQIFDLNGIFICRLGDSAGSNPGGIFGLRARLFTMAQSPWIDGSGRIYVPDAAEGRVRVTDKLGPEMRDIGAFGRGVAQLLLPSDVAIDSTGRLFVAATNNARIEMFGLDDFTDTEAFAPARVVVTPRDFDHTSPPDRMVALIEVPGYPLAAIDVSTITANGVPGDPASVQQGDADGDREPDLTIEFDAAAIAQTLPPDGRVRIEVRGAMAALDLDGWDVIAVTGGTRDTDGDGVPDDTDLCPGTAAGVVVDSGGCGIAQHCPCTVPVDGGRWKNHGKHVSCIGAVALRFARLGLIEKRKIGAFVRGAARGDCGRKAKHRRKGRPR